MSRGLEEGGGGRLPLQHFLHVYRPVFGLPKIHVGATCLGACKSELYAPVRGSLRAEDSSGTEGEPAPRTHVFPASRRRNAQPKVSQVIGGHGMFDKADEWGTYLSSVPNNLNPRLPRAYASDDANHDGGRPAPPQMHSHGHTGGRGGGEGSAAAAYESLREPLAQPQPLAAPRPQRHPGAIGTPVPPSPDPFMNEESKIASMDDHARPKSGMGRCKLPRKQPPPPLAAAAALPRRSDFSKRSTTLRHKLIVPTMTPASPR